eukprot:CAMPEP_0203981430 /NCGR_PEP_ID=MMETSP0360-20130528/2207_1 /ASSEMBLY_ACC=CAM_ASM_000342 /TAXON_ID=268821 /ORGANISM="Scrippsiella Hangoei, Strain SHTV-5" /LENGTH=300 /DNA_ID=CAMNT_0050919991 /DNA_START=14 /DNA_END=912 /DNA_ORIENTATION=-
MDWFGCNGVTGTGPLCAPPMCWLECKRFGRVLAVLCTAEKEGIFSNSAALCQTHVRLESLEDIQYDFSYNPSASMRSLHASIRAALGRAGGDWAAVAQANILVGRAQGLVGIGLGWNGVQLKRAVSVALAITAVLGRSVAAVKENGELSLCHHSAHKGCLLVCQPVDYQTDSDFEGQDDGDTASTDSRGSAESRGGSAGSASLLPGSLPSESDEEVPLQIKARLPLGAANSSSRSVASSSSAPAAAFAPPEVPPHESDTTKWVAAAAFRRCRQAAVIQKGRQGEIQRVCKLKRTKKKRRR